MRNLALTMGELNRLLEGFPVATTDEAGVRMQVLPLAMVLREGTKRVYAEPGIGEDDQLVLDENQLVSHRQGESQERRTRAGAPILVSGPRGMIMQYDGEALRALKKLVRRRFPEADGIRYGHSNAPDNNTVLWQVLAGDEVVWDAGPGVDTQISTWERLSTAVALTSAATPADVEGDWLVLRLTPESGAA